MNSLWVYLFVCSVLRLMSVSMSSWLTTQFHCTCLSASIPTPRVCQSAWIVMLSRPAPQPEVGANTMHSNLGVYCCLTSGFVCSTVLVCQQVFPPLGCVSLPDFVCSTVLVCQQLFPPLGCVSLPDLSCYPKQHPSQKWVQILCTQIWVCTVV